MRKEEWDGMKFEERDFIPVILGGDINTYSVARAFYDKYGVRSYVFGKFPTGPSYGSNITVYEADRRIDTPEYFVKRINDFAAEHSDRRILLIGCGDSYVALASEYRDRLADNVIVPYTEFELMDSLQHKETFYGLCEKYGLDYPATLIYRQEMGEDYRVDFRYPVIVKPSNSIMYWEHPFPGQEKVFRAGSEEEVRKILHSIYDAGYDDAVIIQDMIPGNDEYMRVLTSYSDSKGKVKMMCLGHVLLEEHTPHGSGNHAVIIPEYEKELMEKARRMLEDVGYVGFSNFDIKYDSRDGSYRFFEINTRQGRSNYYVTNAGFNVAEYLVEDWVYGRELEYRDDFSERLWLTVPAGVARKYVKQPENAEKLNRLLKEGKYVNPVFRKGDNGFMRWLRMVKTHLKQYSNFKKYYE